MLLLLEKQCFFFVNQRTQWRIQLPGSRESLEKMKDGMEQVVANLNSCSICGLLWQVSVVFVNKRCAALRRPSLLLGLVRCCNQSVCQSDKSRF